MNERRSLFWSLLMVGCLLITACVIAAYIVVGSFQQTTIDSLTLDLQTSIQREAKQNYEYEQAAAAAPILLAEEELLRPKATYYRQEVQRLKEYRKTLRQQVKELSKTE